MKRTILFLLISISAFAQNGTQINVPLRDATTTIKGRIKLAGDLSGTANAPTVPALATKLPISNVNGTANYVPKFTGTNSIGNSQIFDSGSAVGIGTTSPSYKVDVTGTGRFTDDLRVKNIVIGYGTGNIFTNTSVGMNSMQQNTTGNNNTAFGHTSLFANTTGSINTSVGVSALGSNTTGTENIGVGYISGYDNTTGSRNLFLGTNTGRGITTGNNNTILGSNVVGLLATLSDNVIIANGLGAIRLQAFSSGNIGIATNLDAGYKFDVNGTFRTTQLNLSALNTAPSSATATGTVGEIRVTSTHVYVCISANTWVRTALSTW